MSENEKIESTDKKVKKSRWDAFKAEWSHAFSMKVADDQFNEEDIKMINNVAKDIVRRKLASPAILFLVSIHPLSFFMSQLMYFIKPFVPSHDTAARGKDFAERFALKTLLLEPGAFERFAVLMESQEGVDKLLAAIEKHENIRIKQEKTASEKEKSKSNR
jgi:hypothetical protein